MFSRGWYGLPFCLVEKDMTFVSQAFYENTEKSSAVPDNCDFRLAEIWTEA